MTLAIDPLCQPFVDGLEQCELRYQTCLDCFSAQCLARFACRVCGSRRFEWKRLQGLGTVIARSMVSRAPSNIFKPLVPYTLVLVHLDEGVRMMGHGQSQVSVGDRVSAAFFRHDRRRLLRFEGLGT